MAFAATGAPYWSGTFIFFSIWTVFGFLGIALLGRTANPTLGNSLAGMSPGLDIWAIVLTFIAMYVAGHETARLAAVATRHDGVTHGIVMFGLSAMAVLLLVFAGRGNTVINNPGALGEHARSLLDLPSNVGWTAFLSLLFGWLAAMGGAASATPRRTISERVAQPIRPAA